MAAKIILISPSGSETKVANFKANIEAFQAASLFNAILHPDSRHIYIVEYKAKGITRRTTPDTLKQTVSNITTLHEHLKPIF